MQSNELMKYAEEINGTSKIRKNRSGLNVACLPFGGIALPVMQFLYKEFLAQFRYHPSPTMTEAADKKLR